jgi:hypothetical protein
MKIQPQHSLVALAIAAAFLLAALFLMARHHNQGANLRSPAGPSQGPG